MVDGDGVEQRLIHSIAQHRRKAFDRETQDNDPCKVDCSQERDTQEPGTQSCREEAGSVACEVGGHCNAFRRCEKAAPFYHEVAQHERPSGRTQGSSGWYDADRRRKRLGGAILELQASQARVEPTARVEARVRSFFDDSPIVHDDDPVGSANGSKPMRNHDRRPMLHQAV